MDGPNSSPMIEALRHTSNILWAWLRPGFEELVPARIRELLSGSGRRWILDLTAEEAALLDPERQRRIPCVTSTTLRRHGIDQDNLVLRLPTGSLLRKTVDLPLAATDSLDHVLRFEMDRLTPFRDEDVHFTWRIVGRNPAEKKVTVQIDLVTRAVASEALARARGLGAEPIGIELGQGGSIHQVRPADPMIGRLRWLQLTLLAALITFSIGIGWAELRERQQRLDEASAELAVAKAQAERAEALRIRIETRMRQASFATDRRAERPLLVEVLDELTRLLPDHSSLTQLRLQEDQVEISGTSRSVTEIVRQLETGRFFGEVAYRAPVTRDEKDGFDRFQLGIRLRQARG